jgi:hypothetical protein
MHIVVRRSGGLAGIDRTWRVDTETVDDPEGWYDLVDTLPREEPGRRRGTVADDHLWTITVARTTVSVPGSRLEGPWADLVDRVQDEGAPD